MDEEGLDSVVSPFQKSPNGIKSIFNFANMNQVKINNSQLEDFGRDSLGIIDLNHPDFGRESLTFLYSPKVDDFGRDSLGIINLNELSLNKEPLEITSLQASSDNSLFNNAFIMPSETSISTSVSSLNSVSPSFNLAYLDGTIPSCISSVSSDKTDFLNKAFIGSANYIKQFQLCMTSSIYSSKNNKNIEDVHQPHFRTYSLPSCFEENKKKRNLIEDELKKDYSAMEDASFSRPNDDIDDLVFIEANHLAYRLGNESALNLEDCEDDLLDSFQEPEGFAEVINDNNNCLKNDQETVFKTVDKMLPPVRCGDSDYSYSNTKDPKEILNTLSEILSNSNPTDQQKSEGQNLLSSLAEILISSGSGSIKSNYLDDSGHSSVENEPIATSQKYDFYKVFDLRKKSLPEINVERTDLYDCTPLDLSFKSKSQTMEKIFASPKILPPKFSNSQRSLIQDKSIRSNCSLSNSENGSFDLIKKFKPKKNEEKIAKKGPIKAVIPVDNMARKKAQKSPTRTKIQAPKLKKTSTPIKELNIKPMAQSTPDAPYPVSPLNKPDSGSKFIKHKLNYSGPVNSKSLNIKPSFTRRRSEEDLKKVRSSGRSFVRSYSMGDSALKSTLNRFNSKSQVNRSVNKESASKKIGKENVSQGRF